MDNIIIKVRSLIDGSDAPAISDTCVIIQRDRITGPTTLAQEKGDRVGAKTSDRANIAPGDVQIAHHGRCGKGAIRRLHRSLVGASLLWSLPNRFRLHRVLAEVDVSMIFIAPINNLRVAYCASAYYMPLMQ